MTTACPDFSSQIFRPLDSLLTRRNHILFIVQSPDSRVFSYASAVSNNHCWSPQLFKIYVSDVSNLRVLGVAVGFFAFVDARRRGG
jgi:hypothetical protein